MSEQKDDGGPAFPISTDFGPKLHSAEGMTQRVYIATHALQGVLASYAGSDQLPKNDVAAQAAVGYADALLTALAMPPAPSPERAAHDLLDALVSLEEAARFAGIPIQQEREDVGAALKKADAAIIKARGQ